MIFISKRSYKPGVKTDRSNTHSEVAAPLHIHHACSQNTGVELGYLTLIVAEAQLQQELRHFLRTMFNHLHCMGVELGYLTLI